MCNYSNLLYLIRDTQIHPFISSQPFLCPAPTCALSLLLPGNPVSHMSHTAQHVQLSLPSLPWWRDEKRERMPSEKTLFNTAISCPCLSCKLPMLSREKLNSQPQSFCLSLFGHRLSVLWQLLVWVHDFSSLSGTVHATARTVCSECFIQLIDELQHIYISALFIQLSGLSLYSSTIFPN